MATVPAILGTARLGNFRLGYRSAALAAIRRTRVRILLAGTDVRTRIAGLSIRKPLNESPDTASLTVHSPAPTSGQAIRITLNSDAPRLLFAGTVQTDDLTYQGKPTQLVYPCTAIDDTARVNKKRPFGTWTNVSATTVAQALVSSFAPGFSASGVAAGLPLVTITFDGTTSFMGCLAQLATLIGGYCNVEDGIVYLFLTDATEAPDPITTGYPFCDAPPITVSRDDSQLATRVYGKGHAEALLVDIAAGQTILPVADAVMFNVAGGQVIASTTSDGAASERLAYTGIVLPTGGAIVGPGAAPSVAPLPTLTPGSGLGVGYYGYAYVDVTPSGRSLPSPRATIQVGVPVTDPLVTNATQDGSGVGTSSWAVGDVIQYATTYLTSSGETLAGPLSTPFLATAAFGSTPHVANVTMPVSPDPAVIDKRLYRLRNGGWAGYRSLGIGLTSLQDGSPLTAGSPPVTNTTAAGRVNVDAIAIGGGATTQREVYRTVVQATAAAAATAQLKLLTTIANNTSTGPYLDSTVDGSLGANAPTSDTSGLTQPVGQVNAGSTSLTLAGTGGLPSSGWIITVGGDVVRYTGISGNALTGIPPVGTGAILTTLFYGDTIAPAPALIGVTGLTTALAKGASVHIWVQRDDLGAQAAATARESTAGYVSDGVHEVTITDERRGEASLTARCDAHLVLFANPIVTVKYATRDVKTKSGKPVTITLASPPISQTLTIQDVTITEIDTSRVGTAPKFTVTASSVRFSLEDLLRRMNALLD